MEQRHGLGCPHGIDAVVTDALYIWLWRITQWGKFSDFGGAQAGGGPVRGWQKSPSNTT